MRVQNGQIIDTDYLKIDTDNDGYWDGEDKNPLIFFPYIIYDRQAAINYAEIWYDSDGIIQINGGNIFPQNVKQDFYYYTLGDCANFVSQCLLAGGYEMYGNSDIDVWHYYNENNASESWRLADNQFRYFRDSDYTLSELIINKNNYQNLNNTITTYNIRKDEII